MKAITRLLLLTSLLSLPVYAQVRIGNVPVTNDTVADFHLLGSASTGSSAPAKLLPMTDIGTLLSSVPTNAIDSTFFSWVEAQDKTPTNRYNIIDYGAVPNDADSWSNSQWAIQYCMDLAATNGGGIVYVPQGTFYCSNYVFYTNLWSERHTNILVIRSNNITLLGEGHASIIKLCAGPGGSDVRNWFGSGEYLGEGHDWAGATNIVFKDLTLDGTAPDQTYSYDCTQVYNAGPWTFDNVKFMNIYNDAIDVASPWLVVRGCFFTNVNDTCVQLSSQVDGPRALVSDCYVINCGDNTLGGGGYLIEIGNGSMFIRDTYVEGSSCDELIRLLSSGSYLWCDNVQFRSVGADNYNSIVNTAGGLMSFKNCYFSTAASVLSQSSTLITNYQSNLEIENCHFEYKRALHSVQSKSTIVRNSRLAAGTPAYQAAIHIDGGTNIIIEGNYFDGATGGWAANLGASLVINDGVFRNNVLSSNSLMMLSAARWDISGNTLLSKDSALPAGIRVLGAGAVSNSFVGNVANGRGDGVDSIRLQSQRNYFSGNTFDDVVFSDSGGTSNMFFGNLIGNVDYILTGTNLTSAHNVWSNNVTWSAWGGIP